MCIVPWEYRYKWINYVKKDEQGGNGIKFQKEGDLWNGS